MGPFPLPLSASLRNSGRKNQARPSEGADREDFSQQQFSAIGEKHERQALVFIYTFTLRIQHGYSMGHATSSLAILGSCFGPPLFILFSIEAPIRERSPTKDDDVDSFLHAAQKRINPHGLRWSGPNAGLLIQASGSRSTKTGAEGAESRIAEWGGSSLGDALGDTRYLPGASFASRTKVKRERREERRGGCAKPGPSTSAPSAPRL